MIAAIHADPGPAPAGWIESAYSTSARVIDGVGNSRPRSCRAMTRLTLVSSASARCP